MSSHDTDQPDARPVADAAEADAAEQAVPVGPDDTEVDPIDEAASRVERVPLEADPADVWEQTLPVTDSDDEYDHDSREG